MTEETNDTPIQMFSSFEAKQRLQPQDWERVELRYWGKHRLPYISDVNRKLSNTETLALIRSNFETCSRIPQACRRNSVFVINSNNLKHLDDIKSDLNGIFKRCLEAKCKIFDINEKCVKAISSNKNNKLEEGQFFIHINRRENIHGLIRNIVYFKDKNKATINSKVVLQYYINRKKCGDKEEVQYTAPNHGNSGAEKPFFTVKKTTLQNFKKKAS